ncbi:hypothetical [Parasynechococcus marenigrum WH 8102]|uniref:Uncharacterized protein n=1 Tax=Parasynechococcus marenigrum (strain WH8102) TaxID=84588 RepID=Q7U7N0_PARMW|nr:hypothetical [Parasynechococcus marenigrum WH 8102]
MSKQLLEMSFAVGGWLSEHSEDQCLCGGLLGSNSVLVQKMTIDRNRFHPFSLIVWLLKAQISIGIRRTCSFKAYRTQTWVLLKYKLINLLELSG